MHKFIFTIHLILIPFFLCAQPVRIYLDGQFNDWQPLSPLHSDPPGDVQNGDIDFYRLWMSNDEHYLFFKIEIGAELNLQDGNAITLYLDTDNNSQTGIAIHGIGAELMWNFGNRVGSFTANGNTITIRQNQIGVVSAPTVSDSIFEIAISRTAQPDGQNPLFTGTDIRIVLHDQGPGGDFLPDAPGGVNFSFDNAALPPLSSISIAKTDTNSIRTLSYNVLSDGFFDSNRLPYFTRVLQALQPDIIGFQEIYGHSAQETVDMMESILPSGGQQQWYGAKVAPDVIAVSRYPIVNTFPIEGYNTNSYNGAFLIDLTPKFDTQLLFIVAHTPCCNNNQGRQYEIDAIMAFIRDAQNGDGVLTLPPYTPILIVGDMNLVGDAQQLRTLLTGEIINTNPFGESFIPDWDGTNLQDLLPRHINLPMFFTWYSETSYFSPGRLDFMIYTDSVLETVKSYLLFTPSLPPDTLSAYNLQPDDAILASDHLPVINDIVVVTPNGMGEVLDAWPDQFYLAQNYPNPFNSETLIHYELSPENGTGFSQVELSIFTLLGQRIRLLVNELQAAGKYQVTWDGKNDRGEQVASGIYFNTLQVSALPPQTGNRVLTRRMVLLR